MLYVMICLPAIIVFSIDYLRKKGIKNLVTLFLRLHPVTDLPNKVYKEDLALFPNFLFIIMLSYVSFCYANLVSVERFFSTSLIYSYILVKCLDLLNFNGLVENKSLLVKVGIGFFMTYWMFRTVISVWFHPAWVQPM
jgi:hypothetical protein